MCLMTFQTLQQRVEIFLVLKIMLLAIILSLHQIAKFLRAV